MKTDTKSKEYLSQIRHSASHLMTAAIESLWPDVLQTIGPSIENGFYHDYDFVKDKITDSDFEKIEKKMSELVKSWHSFSK